MRRELKKLPINGTVVIGEGEWDEAPMLFIGEKVGTGGQLALHHPYRPFQIRPQDRAVEWRDHHEVRPPQPVMAMHHCHHD